MRSIKHRVLKRVKDVRHTLVRRKVPSHILVEDIPYFAQWESPGLVSKIIDKSLSAKDDPKWRSSGAKTKEEYLEWSWNMCGMACLKMILAHALDKNVPIVVLGKRCEAYGGYTRPFDSSNGLDYRKFVSFAREEFGLQVNIVSPMVLKDIQLALASGHYVIASVSPDVRDPLSMPKTKGGHLVLMTGYDLEKKVLYLHNPSGTANSQRHAVISFADFAKFFAHRGIVVKTD